MFSGELLGEIYTDDRMRSVPIEHSSTVLRVVQDAIEKRHHANAPSYSKIVKDVCTEE